MRGFLRYKIEGDKSMRLFYIVLEIVWVVLGVVCLGMAIYLQRRGYSQPMFYILSAIAFGMAIFRFMTRRRRERGEGRQRLGR